jgi:hypothetical protein
LLLLIAMLFVSSKCVDQTYHHWLLYHMYLFYHMATIANHVYKHTRQWRLVQKQLLKMKDSCLAAEIKNCHKGRYWIRHS